MNRGQMRTYVLDRLSISAGDSARVAQIDAALFREYQRLAVEYELGADEASLIFTAADPVVDLPDDTGKILAVRTSDRVLRQLTRQQLAAERAGQGTSTISAGPVCYVQEAPSRIRVWPAPTEDSNTGATLEYVIRPVAWSTSSEDDDEAVPYLLPEEYHDLPCERVIVRVAMSEEEAAMAASSRLIADELESRLSTHLNQRAGQYPSQIPVPGLS